MTDPYRTFRGLSLDFHQAYFDWHSSGQYEGVEEFSRIEEVWQHPPPRERDDWYGEELRIIDECYRRLSDSRVLEIGCGDGNLTWKLAQRCQFVESWDLDAEAVKLTRARLEELNLTNARIETRGGNQVRQDEIGRYDVVFFVQVLEHVPGWQQAELFDRVFRLVAPGGCLFISTPNRWKIRDGHDTGKLFIHWLPRLLRVPLARAMNWGIPGHDPAWPYPPVLHDYVSFRWMRKRARRACPGVHVSQMQFYPSVHEWLAARAERAEQGGGWKHAARRLASLAGRVLPLNYYFGDKVVFAKPRPRAMRLPLSMGETSCAQR